MTVFKFSDDQLHPSPMSSSEPEPGAEGMPQWAKIVGVLIVLLLLLIAVGVLLGGHGPGIHSP